MSYENLVSHFRRVSDFEELDAVVNWDQAVNTPPAAGAKRARAQASLSRLIHDLVADPRVSDWLHAAGQEPQLTKWEQANLSEMRRVHKRARALGADLVEATTQACKQSELAWRRYRAENDFESFAPHLELVVERQREVAETLSAQLDLSPYDALMDAYDPGIRAAVVDEAFAPLRAFLPTFIDEVIEYQSGQELTQPLGPFPLELQKTLAHRMMVVSGLDMTRVRLDESHHPFCGGVPRDVRITNRYHEDEFLSGLMGVLHESGHAKYEQNLPMNFLDQPVGKARGMVLHESQSLLQEMQVSRGEEFLTFLAQELKAVMPEAVARKPEAYTLSNLKRLQTRVRRGLIRVVADEVTYPAHILVRYDLERDLIDGRLAVPELPQAWDDKMRTYLGLSTEGNDADGCMQDVHWPSGAFGYFPLYTLGAIVSAQLFSAAREALPHLADRLAQGDHAPLNLWLGERIWSKGSSESLDELLRGATGHTLDPQFFVAHLRTRYRP